MRASHTRLALLALGIAVCMNGPLFFLQFRVFGLPWNWEGPVVRESFVALAVASVVAVVFSQSDPGSRAGLSPAERRAVALVAVMTLWIVATSLWSVAPDVTRGRATLYVGLACFAWLLSRLRFEDLRAVLVGACVAVLAASLAAVVSSESIGVDRNGDWRGIFTNRNSLAPIAALAIILGIGSAIERGGRLRPGAVGVAGLGAVLMFGSGSRTAWLAMFGAIAIGLAVVGTRAARDRWGPAGIAAGAAVSAAGAAVVAVIVGSLWNESTFVQRRTIWDLVGDQIAERPWHGHGWFTMWTQPEFTSGHELLQRGSAHGSIHEVGLGAGLIGVVGFLALVGLALANAGVAAWRNPSTATWMWLSVVAFLVIENLTESFVLWFSYNWVLLLVAALSVGSAVRTELGPQTPEPVEPAIA